MGGKSSNKSKVTKRTKVKKVDKLPKTGSKGSVVQMNITLKDGSKGKRFFENTGRDLYKPVVDPSKKK